MNRRNFNPDRCPACGYAVDCATEIHTDVEAEQPKPKPGDFSLCLNCGQLNVFNDQLQLVLASSEAEAVLAPDQFAEVRKAQRIIQERGLIR